MKNQILSDMFDRMADVLELGGEDPFKVNAYRKASRVIKELKEDIENVWKTDRLNTLPGVGTGLAKKIEEFLKTGRMTKYEEIIGSVPSDLVDLLGIQNLGPKTLARAHKELAVNTLEDLKQVIQNGRLAQLPGMGQKKVENILKGIALREESTGRIPLGKVLPVVDEIIHALRKHLSTGRIYPAGSVRRMQETVGDIDILVETDPSRDILEAFTSLPLARRILGRGKTKASILIEGNIQVDLRAVSSDSYGAALQYFTGSQAHNVRLRSMAKEQGYKLNEYGIFKGEKKIGGETEEEIYEMFDLTWIPPELREDRGEIEAAVEGRLPELVDLYDINGDFHVHTNWSDGTASIKEMAQKAASMGYTFIGICDHSSSAAYAGGLTPERLLEQIKKIREANREIQGIRILSGAEVDIRTDGTLDFADEILAELDIVIASVHSGFKHHVTERFITASRNPYVSILAHPTGRIIGQREGYEVDLDRVMNVCVETGTALELNAYYERLDLNDTNTRKAKEAGIKIAIGTDAHNTDHLDAMRLGLGVARRGWLEKRDVLNSLSVAEILKFSKRKRLAQF